MRKLLQKIRSKGKQTDRYDSDSMQNSDPREDLGLKIIYEVARPSVDIVAIHSDDGHYEKSWTHPETRVFWLRDLLPHITPSSRILSFGYRASKLSMIPVEDIALSLLKDLSKLRQNSNADKRPIIFLSHSFGVILLKGALGISHHSEFNNITASTHSIIFFGSPPGTSQYLDIPIYCPPRMEAAVVDSPVIIAMKKVLMWLRESHARYEELEKSGKFEIAHFLESSGNNWEGSETLGLENWQEKPVHMKKTHGMMVKFPNAEDEDFWKVQECVIDMVERL